MLTFNANQAYGVNYQTLYHVAHTIIFTPLDRMIARIFRELYAWIRGPWQLIVLPQSNVTATNYCPLILGQVKFLIYFIAGHPRRFITMLAEV